MNRLFIGLMVVAFAAAVLWAAGPVMRETDQASLIEGGWQLRQGKSPLAPGFHIYDKQFLSYAIVAAPLPRSAGPIGEREIRHLVSRINHVTAILFLVGLAVFAGCLCRRPFRSRGIGVPLLAFLAAPTILLSASLAGSAIISAAFLLALGGILALRPFSLQPVAAGVLAFLAVGARADAVLCLPVLCWATVRNPTWKALWRSPNHRAMAAGSLGALFLGLWLAGGETPVLYEKFLEAPVFSVYLTFGLGSLLLLALGTCGALISRLGKSQGFWMAGIVFLFLPLGFYGWQLFSPRHLMTSALAILLVATGWHGRALWRLSRKTSPLLARSFAVSVAGLTFVSLLVGVHLPFPTKPQLVRAMATRFPTSDGLWPMGATISFLSDLRSSYVTPLDHNQAIWNAATRDGVRWPDSGPTMVLETPMRQYLFLALRWSGRDPLLLPMGETGKWIESAAVVSDERSLRTLNPGQVNPSGLARYDSSLAGIKGTHLEVISPDIEGHTIVRLLSESKESQPVQSDPGLQVRQSLAVALRNEEFRREREFPGTGGFEPTRSHEGRTLAFSSRHPFTIDGVDANRVTDLSGSPFYVSLIPGDDRFGTDSIAIGGERPVTLWSTVLPDYMSRNQFRSDRGIASIRVLGKRPPKEIAARSGNSGARDASAP